MADVIGPCLSVSASGRVGGLEFKRMGNGKHQVIQARRAPKTRSAAQDNQAARFKASSTAWSSLTSGQKAAWKAAATTAGTIGYRFYLSEYMNQGIVPPNQPTIP